MRKGRQEALNKLKQAKKGLESRVSQYSVAESEDLLIDMPEEEYKKLVQERSKQKFIVDDLGIGYDDEGEFDIGQEEEEELKQEQFLEQSTHGSQSITSYLRPDVMKRPKLAPTMQKEKKDTLKASLLRDLEDDDCKVEDILVKPLEKLEKKPDGKKFTLGKNQSEENMSQRYNVPLKKLMAVEPIVAIEPMNIDAESVNCKRKEPGALPEVIKPIEVETNYFPEETFPEVISETVHEEILGNEGFMEVDHQGIETLTLSDSHELPLENGNELNLYWIDALEDRELVPGSVYLFGKIFLPNLNKFTGVCVVVQEVTRSFYVLPKPEYQERLGEVDEELESYRKKYSIRKWVKAPVIRKYAFEVAGVPIESEYIKVRYSSKFPVIKFESPKTFSHVFGTKTSLVETVLVKRKLKGPCWVKIRNVLPSKHKISNCRIEVVINSHKDISYGIEESNKLPPPLVMLSIAMKTRNIKGFSEILSISGTMHDNIDQTSSTIDHKNSMGFFSLINRNKPGKRIGIIETFSSEKDLIFAFLDKIAKIDPDIIAGHDLLTDTLEKIISRFHICKVNNWSSLGRVLRQKFPQNRKEENYTGNWQVRALTAGRLLLDTVASSKELIRETTYTLTALAKKWFNTERAELEFDLTEAFTDESKAVMVADHTKKDSLLVHQIVGYLNIIPLTKQLTNVAGNLWARSLQNQRAERNEMLLVHEFHKYKFIVPDKAEKKFENKAEKKKNQYSGGLVLSPIAGLYDKFVILLDFNSLYPSIIREFNICFTTVSRPSENDGEVDNTPGSIISDAGPGILPEIIKDLVTRRRATKNAMKSEKNPLRLKQLDIKQQALKLTANSLYGCLGFKQSRFYARAIAALITQLGRNTLENTVKVARENLNLEVIYGDTDSIMINTNLTSALEAVKKGDELKRIVNKQFRHLEIELDGVYQSMLLLKKKKYAAIKIENGVTIREVKGLDMVRRDWSGLSKKISSNILDLILSNYSKEEIAENIKGYIEQFMKDYDSSTLGEFIIYKQLTKGIEAYKDAANQPHVQVAKRLIEKGETNIQKHFIPYIICEGPENNIAARAYHPDEVNISKGALRPDKKWYINQQIIPPIQRLIAPIDLIKIEEIVELLGEDPTKYHSVHRERENIIQSQGVPILAKCPIAEHAEYDIKTTQNSLNCPNCPINLSGPAGYVKNAVTQFIKKKVTDVYSLGYQCNEFSCKNITKNRKLIRCNREHCNGKMVAVESLRGLFRDLQSIVDLDDKISGSIKETVKNVLNKSKYIKVSLKHLCSNIQVDLSKLFLV